VQHWYAEAWTHVDIYIATPWSESRISAFAETLAQFGYGRDQTAGMGAIALVQKPVPAGFPVAGKGAFLSLSRCMPCGAIDLSRSAYTCGAKYGKVWQGLETHIPFKKAVLQTAPGATLYATECKGVYGRVATGVHPHDGVLENCMTIPYFLPSEEAHAA
jgi:hypothetical protein